MIGHDAPGNESVSALVSFEKYVLHDLGVLRIAEMTFPMARVFIVNDSTGEFFLGSLSGFDLWRLEKVVQLSFPFFDDGIGEAISFAESNGL